MKVGPCTSIDLNSDPTDLFFFLQKTKKKRKKKEIKKGYSFYRVWKLFEEKGG